jgi:hypothetical protein
MLRLELRHSASVEDLHWVRVEVTGGGRPQAAVSEFVLATTPQDREDVRWYLEDYLEYPLDPSPVIAARVERRLRELGEELFGKLFPDGSEARSLWEQVSGRLGEARVEVATDLTGATAIPWELLCEPGTDTPVALQARSFVRVPQPIGYQAPFGADDQGLRVLLVICRPRGDDDVPFRSVASHLVRLSGEARQALRLEVLRPPTLARLEHVLRAAADQGKPYQVVHFDGHGIYADRPNRGYLVFEAPGAPRNRQLVDGSRLGGLLVEAGVPVLVLNACRSAHAEIATQPERIEESAAAEAQGRVRAYGSLAQEVVEAGVAGVVAMRYSIYVVTAAQFVGDLYTALLAGQPLGEAVTAGRKQLAAHPGREVALISRPLQDWTVPIVYETSPLTLCRGRQDDQQATISANQADSGERPTQLHKAGLPSGPERGFYGRDETLLALDRAFDAHRVVLLSGYAGSGKTTTAVEFARWYQRTGGVRGPVLFTSFERYTSLSHVLDQVGQALQVELDAEGIDWMQLADRQRPGAALRILAASSVLWIWDNVEPITGFPAGSPSVWTEHEQRELRDFLRAISGTAAKVLVTSRREERDWLGDLPARVTLPPMSMRDCVQLASALAKEHDQELGDLETWRPLLTFSQGNPLTLVVVMRQALQDRLSSRGQVERFVAKLRAGAAALEGDERHGRSASLSASLEYGLQHAFTDRQREQLALLYLFRGSVNAGILHAVWYFVTTGSIKGIQLDMHTTKEAIALLERATEIGLLTPVGGGHYTIHPAVSWHFQRSAKRHGISSTSDSEQSHHEKVFVDFYSDMASTMFRDHAQGNDAHSKLLAAEEANLLEAQRLARTHRNWKRALKIAQLLTLLYDQTGRRFQLRRLLDETLSDLIDPATKTPLTDDPNEQFQITMWVAGLATELEDYENSERLLASLIAQERTHIATGPNAARVNELGRLLLGSLLCALGNAQRARGKIDCVATYEEAYALARDSDSTHLQQMLSLNLSRAYAEVTKPPDLVKAETFASRSLELCAISDNRARAACMIQLGQVYWQRLHQAAESDRSREDVIHYAQEFASSCWAALSLLPPDAVEQRAAVLARMGNAFGFVGDLKESRQYFQESIQLYSDAGRLYEAAKVRGRAALNFRRHGAYQDALAYAEAALSDFRQLGKDDDIAIATRVVAEIKEAIQE